MPGSYHPRAKPVTHSDPAGCLVGAFWFSRNDILESAEPEHERVNLAALVEDIQVVSFDVPAGVACGPIRMASRDSKNDHLDKMVAAHAVSLGVPW